MSRWSFSQEERQKQHVTKINNENDPALQLRYAINYALAELAQCDRRCPGDAPGLRRQLAHRVTLFAIDISKGRLDQLCEGVLIPVDDSEKKPDSLPEDTAERTGG